ncbi:MAG: YceD family protein [Bifidobacteriaceae bacterium]|jgi:uncharacterized protein|nr:YceD family protein [Bifidobacteriaceae bacterium]
MPPPSPSQLPELTVSVRELGRQAGSAKRLEIDFKAPPGFGTQVAQVPEGQEVHLELLLEAVSEGVLASGSAQSQATGECARCLADVPIKLDVTFQELYHYADLGQPQGHAEDQMEDELAVVSDAVDLSTPVWDALVLALPFQPLCAEDCQGLCPECGLPLVEAPGHGHRQIDPRWAALEDLLEDQKEES